MNRDFSPAVVLGCIFAVLVAWAVTYGLAVFVIVKIIKAALA